MKIAFALLGLCLVAASARAGIIIDVVVATEEDLAKGSFPLACVAEVKADGSVVVKATAKQLVFQEFSALELFVQKDPVDVARLQGDYFKSERIERRQRSREKSVEFWVAKDDIPKAYVTIESSAGYKQGMAVIRTVCVPVTLLLRPVK